MSDPLQLFLAVIFAGLVLAAVFVTLREAIAQGIDLHAERKERRDRERRRGA